MVAAVVRVSSAGGAALESEVERRLAKASGVGREA